MIRRSKYSLSKAKLAGSIGKNTTIVSSDADFILFVGIKKCPDSESLDKLLCDILDDFKRVLENFGIQYPIEDVDKKKYSLTFNVRNIKFDLLPAIDFVGNVANLKQQQQATLDVMKSNLSRYVYRFSSSLAFLTVDFMKRQSGFAHEMSRFAKIWYKSACIDEHVSGANYAMELVAVFVVQQMTTNSRRDAVCNFLKAIINFDRIDIVFADEYRHLKGHAPSSTEPLPRVLDPSNPYNNLGRSFTRKPHVIAALIVHAHNTMKNLQ